MTLLIQAEKGSSLSLGFVRGGHGDGFSVYLRPSLDARHPASFAAARTRLGRRRGTGRPGARLRNVNYPVAQHRRPFSSVFNSAIVLESSKSARPGSRA